MSSNVLVTGLFPERNRTFFSALCREFDVIAFRHGGFVSGAQHEFTYAESLIGGTPRLDAERLSREMARCLRFTEQQLEQLLGLPCELTEAEYGKLFAHGMFVATEAERLCRLAREVPIDLLVTSADYDIHRRPMVLEARRLGIPSLCIEHGFSLTVSPTRRFVKPDHGLFLEYASDHVNLENRIEVEAARENQAFLQEEVAPEFIYHGTPLDCVHDPGLSRESAFESLGLDPGLTTVVLLGEWLGCRTPVTYFKAQLELTESYRQVFESLARRADRETFQVVVKMHPAFAASAVYEEAAACVRKMAARAGIDTPLVLPDRLQQAVAAADVLVSAWFTSVFLDGLLSYTPSVLLPTPSYLDLLSAPAALERVSPLLEHGCVRVAPTADEMWRLAGRWRQPDEQLEFRRSVDRLKQTHGLGQHSSEEKSRRLCAWIREQLAGDERRSLGAARSLSE